MSRAEKIQKLSNAVKSYRGIATPIVGPNKVLVRWTIEPQPDKQKVIVGWLLDLGRTHEQIEADAKAIDGFTTLKEFNAWINSL